MKFPVFFTDKFIKGLQEDTTLFQPMPVRENTLVIDCYDNSLFNMGIKYSLGTGVIVGLVGYVVTSDVSSQSFHEKEFNIHSIKKIDTGYVDPKIIEFLETMDNCDYSGDLVYEGILEFEGESDEESLLCSWEYGSKTEAIYLKDLKAYVLIYKRLEQE